MIIGSTVILVNRSPIFSSSIIARELNATCEMVQDWLQWIFSIGEKHGVVLTIVIVTLLILGVLSAVLKCTEEDIE